MKQITWVVAGLLGAALVGCNGLVDVLKSDADTGALQGTAGAAGAGAGGSQAGGGQAGESPVAGAAGMAQDPGQGGAPQGEGGEAGSGQALAGEGGTAGGAGSGEPTRDDGPIGSWQPESNLGLPLIQMDMGLIHACVLRQDGAIKCWGTGSSLDGSFLDLGTGATVTQIAVGHLHVCALRQDSSVQCWGFNGYGAVGSGFYSVVELTHLSDDIVRPHYVDLGEGAPIIQIVAGASHNCVLRQDSQVQCWGNNLFGQLGLGDSEDRGDEPGEMGASLPFVDLGSGAPVTQIAAGGDVTCVLRADDSVSCWGQGGGLALSSNLGTSPADMGNGLQPVPLGAGAPIKQLVVGFGNACVLRQDGSIKCWGLNQFGQLGLGDTESRGDSPGDMGDFLPTVDLGPGAVAVQISTGGEMSPPGTCALLLTGEVRCWGGKYSYEDQNMRGDEPGEMGTNLPAVDLGPGPAVQQVQVGSDTVCVAREDASVQCWGRNSGGVLGGPQPTIGQPGFEYGPHTYVGDEPGEMGANLPAVDLGF